MNNGVNLSYCLDDIEEAGKIGEDVFDVAYRLTKGSPYDTHERAYNGFRKFAKYLYEQKQEGRISQCYPHIQDAGARILVEEC